MTDERYKKIMADLGEPNSRSLLAVLQQVANEAGQECAAEERKACAKVCERIGAKMTDDCDGAQPGFWPDQVAHRCVAEIMMRSNVSLRGDLPALSAERPSPKEGSTP